MQKLSEQLKALATRGPNGWLDVTEDNFAVIDEIKVLEAKAELWDKLCKLPEGQGMHISHEDWTKNFWSISLPVMGEVTGQSLEEALRKYWEKDNEII